MIKDIHIGNFELAVVTSVRVQIFIIIFSSARPVLRVPEFAYNKICKVTKAARLTILAITPGFALSYINGNIKERVICSLLPTTPTDKRCTIW